MMDRPTQPQWSIRPGSHGHDLLRRVLRVRAGQRLIERITLIEDPAWRIALRDTGPGGTAISTTSRATAIHVLWARDDNAAAIRIHDRELAIAPGDTINLPSDISWSATSGLILCEIAGSATPSEIRSGGMDTIEATHGQETFHGYNRQTTYPSPPGLAIERWKITQPLPLPDAPEPYVIIDLIDPLALMWQGGTDLIGRGECRLIPPGTGPITLLPDGLGYALVVRQRNPEPFLG